MTIKVAVIMSGHPRMVEYGAHFLERTFAGKAATYEVFSYMWTQNSEVRGEFAEAVSGDMAHLNTLKYNRFEDQYQNKTLTYLNGGPLFRSRGAQIVGFVEALNLWHNELRDFDYIIKSRWDQIVDPTVIDLLIKGNTEHILTSTIYMFQGRPELSANLVYGHRLLWEKYFNPVEIVGILDDYIEENIENYSFSAHGIWGYLFSRTGATVQPAGEELPIRSGVRRIPLNLVQTSDVRNIHE